MNTKPTYKYKSINTGESSSKPPEYIKIDFNSKEVETETEVKMYIIKNGVEIEVTPEYLEEIKLEKEKKFKEITDKAIKEQEICCITHDVLTKDNIAVTKCGHVMSIEGALSIMERKTNECPICRGYLIM